MLRGPGPAVCGDMESACVSTLRGMATELLCEAGSCTDSGVCTLLQQLTQVLWLSDA